MALSINSNSASLLVQRYLRSSTSALNVNFERLSSGLRINGAKDGAAELSVSTRLTAQIRGLNQAVANANDGLSLAQIADDALEETTAALQDIRDMAVQASTSTLTDNDRYDLQVQVADLVSEIDRIAEYTEFNDTVLLSGTFTGKTFHVGANAGQTITISIDDAGASALGFSTGGEKVNVSTTGSASTAIGLVDNALDSVTSIRATLGAAQNRFESIISNLENISDNTDMARSRIIDADIAEETTGLARNAILQQAGVAILAQANLQPQMVLELLD
ncbi:MAG: flagellin FliC [Magnetococcales bacterium]|nr:flagellin FliC [Magnetococcales bacterium]